MLTVKIDKVTWEINDITFAEKRKLHMLNSVCFASDGLDQEKYYEMLEETRKLAGYGEGTEKETKLSELTMVKVDTVLQNFLMEYLGLNKSKK
jgi:hypothetical protein|tara:strand:- start:684 stop:962 length:279 start_codon:yes stop_codon:yes gene_type:complete